MSEVRGGVEGELRNNMKGIHAKSYIGESES